MFAISKCILLFTMHLVCKDDTTRNRGLVKISNK